MRCRLTLIVVATLAGGYPVLALAQAPPININPKGAGVSGTGFGGAVRIKPSQIPLLLGTGRFGAGTGGTELGVGNVTGGMQGFPRAGTGGIGDGRRWGIDTGGITGSGRGLNAAIGGSIDQGSLGRNTGGLRGSTLGTGTGGIADLNTLGGGTGGIKENNAPRFQIGR